MITIAQLKSIDWKRLFKRNKYSLISLIILPLYFYITLSAIAFVVTNMRKAFSIDEKAAESAAITFDITQYETIKHRFEQQ